MAIIAALLARSKLHPKESKLMIQKIVLLSIFALISISAFCKDQKPIPDWKKAHTPDNNDWKKVDQHFKFNNGAEPKSLDSGVISGLLEFRLIECMFEGLVSMDPETLVPRPGVAEKWSISKDGLTYKFHLRKNAKWSNGKSVIANDFYKSWIRILDGSIAAPYNYQLFYIVGAEEFSKSKNKKAFDMKKFGVKVINDYLLEVKLKNPTAYFLDIVAFPTLYAVPLETIKKHGDKWILPENIVTNGPFHLSKWDRRQKIIMVKSKSYWDADFVKLETITAFPISRVETAYKKFLNKGMHWLPSVPESKVEEAKKMPEYYQTDSLGTYFYRFNCTKTPFDNAKVRRAFSMAIDRAALTKHVLHDIPTPANWFCPPAAGYKHIKGLNYNPTKAKKLLLEAGVKTQGMTVEITFNTSEGHKLIAEFISQNWEKNLGVKVKLKNMEWKTYLANMTNLDYQIMRGGWYGDYNDPNTFFDMWTKGNGNNRTGWSNKKYDELLLQSQKETVQKKRMALFQKMEQILINEEVPIMPLYIPANKGLVRESVNGYYDNIFGFHPLKYIWLEKE